MEYQRYVIDLVRTLLVRHVNDEDMCVLIPVMKKLLILIKH